MDHAYLETTVAPVLTDALTDLTLRFAGTHASTKGQPHPTIDPIDFIAKYLLRSLASPKWEDPLKADEERRAMMRDSVLTHAQDEQLRKSKEAEDRARAEAAKSVTAAASAPAAATAAADSAAEAAGEPQQTKSEGGGQPAEAVPAIQVTEDAQAQQAGGAGETSPPAAAAAAVDGAPATSPAEAVALPTDAGEEI